MLNFLKAKSRSMPFILFAIASIDCTIAKTQKSFIAKSFKHTTWASNNQNNSFFKSDTIKLVKLGEKYSTASKKDAARYFKNHDFLTIEFSKKHKSTFYLTNVESWTVTEVKGKYSWKFDEKSQVLKFLYNNNPVISLIIIDQNEVEVKSNHIFIPAEVTTEIVFRKQR